MITPESSTPQRAHTLRLLLGDQLNPEHSWFATQDDGVVYVLMEVRQETDYVCLLYTSPSPRDQRGSRMPSSA